MRTIQELRIKAEELTKKEDFVSALPLFREIWNKEKNEWNGYFFAKCLRKTHDYSEAREIHTYIKTNYPKFKIILNEELWLEYSEKVKAWENPNLVFDAVNLLSKTNKYDKYTGSIFNKTVLSVVKHLLHKKEDKTALNWLNKLDFTTLSTSPFTFKGQRYPSDQKAFFVRYADVLVRLDKYVYYIESYLSYLNFEETKHTTFKKYILENITYLDYNGNSNVTRLRLALYLKYFKEEIGNRSKNIFKSIYNPKKITLVSDLGNFEFCPVSYAINETYEIASNESWEKDEWLGKKLHLIDRYNEYQKTKDISEAFNDSSVETNETVKNDFEHIFNSKLIVNNFDGSNAYYFSNAAETIRGSPDYVFESTDGKRYAIIEKFTKKTPENISTAFNNDLIKLYGYIFELTTLNLDFGYLIYWYWQLEDISDDNGNIKKKIRIRTYRIFKVEKSEENKSKLSISINRVKAFKQTGKFEIDGDRITYPNKCLNCSVFSYCNHKTGKYNVINLPYDVTDIILNEESILSFDSNTDNQSEESGDDLPC